MSLFVNTVLNTNRNIITIIEKVPAGTYTMTTIYPDLSSVHSRNTIDIRNNSIGHQASQYYGTCVYSKSTSALNDISFDKKRNRYANKYREEYRKNLEEETQKMYEYLKTQ